MSKPLPKARIAAALENLPGWKLRGNALAKTFRFHSFREAFSFMVHAAFEAEALNHHPDWSNAYDKVSIRLSSHDAGSKVTAKDIELARRIQKFSWVG